MNSGFEQDQLRRLERKVDTLTWVLGVQTVLLFVGSLGFLLRASGYLLMMVLVAGALLIVFRRYVPQWRSKLSQLWGLVDRRRVKVGNSRSS